MPTEISPLDAERTFFRDFFGVGSSPGFGSQLRKAAAQALMRAYETKRDELQKRLVVVNLHQQTCLTFEDIGAVMLAVERKLSKNVDFLETYLTYAPGEAYISKVVADKEDKEILETFGFGEELQDLYTEYGIPREELWRGRRNFLQHIKSVAGTQDERKTICNKMKHGAVVLSHGGGIIHGAGEAEQMCSLSLVRDKNSCINHWNTESFFYSEKEVRFWFEMISNAPSLLKTLAFQYVIRFHPVLRQEWLTEMGLT